MHDLVTDSIFKKLGGQEFSLANLATCLNDNCWVLNHDDNWFKQLYEYFNKKSYDSELSRIFQNARCLLTSQKEDWVKPNCLFKASKIERNLFSEYLLKNNKKYYTHETLLPDGKVLAILRVANLELESIISFYLKDKNWLKECSDDWFLKLYEYLSHKELNGEQLEQLKNLHIIRLELENGTLSQSKQDVFFPFKVDTNYGFEDEFKIIKKTTFEKKDFLKRLGIKEFNLNDIIESHILPLYKSVNKETNWQSKGSKLLGYVRYIKDHINNYGEKTQIKQLLYIRTNKVINGVDYYNYAQNLFIPKIYGNENNLESLFDNIPDISTSFIHDIYYSSIDRTQLESSKDEAEKKEIQNKINQEIKKWKDFFVQLGAKELPDAEAIKKVIAVNSKEKNNLLISILDKNWDKYCKDSSIIKLLSEELKNTNWIPTTQGLSQTIHTFIDNEENKALLQDSVPYLIDKVTNPEFFNNLGINSKPTVKAVCARLKLLIEQKCVEKTDYIKIYGFLHQNFNNNQQFIKNTFTEKVIFCNKSFYSKDKTFWKDVNSIFGKNHGYLVKEYDKNLKTFFVDCLEINEEPNEKNYADRLKELSLQQTLEIKEDSLFKIYEKLNGYLQDRDNEKPAWWYSFVVGLKLWTDTQQFVPINEIFINDDNDLYELFKKKYPKLAFLKLSENNLYPKIKCFLEVLKIRHLSESVKREGIECNKANSKIHNDLTDQIRHFRMYLWRYLYCKHPEEYEKLKSSVLTRFKDLTVSIIDKLDVYFILDNYTLPTSLNLFNDTDNYVLYIKAEHIEETDEIARELAKFFPKEKIRDELKTFIGRLFDKKDNAKIEKLLKDEKIDKLPSVEEKIFNGEKIVDEFYNEKDEEVQEEHNVHNSNEPLDLEPPEQNSQENELLDEESTEGYLLASQSEDNSNDLQASSNNRGHGDYSSSQSVDDTTPWTPECSPKEARINSDNSFTTNDTNRTDREQSNKNNSTKTKPISSSTTQMKQIHHADKIEIGYWGEEYVMEYLKQKFVKKYRGKEVKFDPLKNGFSVSIKPENNKSRKDIARVIWHNAQGDRAIGFDIEIRENGQTYYIEVKSTKTDDKEQIQLSGAQWESAIKYKERYSIYRVYNAGKSSAAKVKEIDNPYQLFLEDKLSVVGVSIKI